MTPSITFTPIEWQAIHDAMVFTATNSTIVSDAHNNAADKLEKILKSGSALKQPKLADRLWDALRLECCSTGLEAQRIVLLSKINVERVADTLTKNT